MKKSLLILEFHGTIHMKRSVGKEIDKNKKEFEGNLAIALG